MEFKGDQLAVAMVVRDGDGRVRRDDSGRLLTKTRTFTVTGRPNWGTAAAELAAMIAFIRARRNEDESAARLAIEIGGEGRWSETASGCIDTRATGELDDIIVVCDLRLSRFIARNNPAHAINRVISDRAIVDDYEARLRVDPDDELAEEALRALALVDDDHPEWRYEWRPIAPGDDVIDFRPVRGRSGDDR